MNKDMVLTTRVDEQTYAIILREAEKDDRTMAWMVRNLIEEGMRARKLLSKKKSPS